MENSQSVVKHNPNTSILDRIINTGTIENLLEFSKTVASSGISPFKEPEQVATLILYATAKKLPFVDVLSHSMILNGRVGIDSHLMRAQVQRAGITHKTLRNYEPIYAYQYKDINITQDEIDRNPEKFIVCYTIDQVKAHLADPSRDSKILPVLRSTNPIDYETKILFKRGNTVTIVSYKLSEAQQAGLLDKNNWKTYPKDCLFARCYTRGAREIADDILFGTLTTEELGAIEIEPYSEYEEEIIEEAIEVK